MCLLFALFAQKEVSLHLSHMCFVSVLLFRESVLTMSMNWCNPSLLAIASFTFFHSNTGSFLVSCWSFWSNSQILTLSKSYEGRIEEFIHQYHSQCMRNNSIISQIYPNLFYAADSCHHRAWLTNHLSLSPSNMPSRQATGAPLRRFLPWQPESWEQSLWWL